MEFLEDFTDDLFIEGIALDMPEIDWVDGYTRSDGTFVNGHFRSIQDQSRLNNLMNW